MTLADGLNLWGMGNAFLLAHPCRMQVQISRRETEAQWEAHQAVLDEAHANWCVFVSPFISPHEQRVLRAVAARGGRAIRLTHDFLGERYKPGGERFVWCCAGRLLEVSVAGEFVRYARLDRAAHLRLNEVAGLISTTQWPQWRV